MDRLNKILVGIEFSPCSAAALQQAVRIGGWMAEGKSQITVIHVVPIPVYPISGNSFLPVELPPVDILLQAAREQWAAWPPAKEAGANVKFEAILGSPRMELLDRALHDGIDLLVLGAHGEAHGQRGVGPVASACVQRAVAKVLVVREGQSDRFRSVVACVDFSETSRLALEQAIRVAAQDNAALHILHVFDDPWRGVGPPPDLKSHMPDFLERYEEAVEKHLRNFCEPLAHEMVALKAQFHALRFEGHGKGILDFVQRERCDLAVLGTRAKWNLRDFLMGSTAERVVREAPCSILAVKPAGTPTP
ncbi:MAG: universal stress protein [Planctomycetes bacterium]|nr:universal stress protein [Planctomycetota bacterium]